MVVISPRICERNDRIPVIHRFGRQSLQQLNRSQDTCWLVAVNPRRDQYILVCVFVRFEGEYRLSILTVADLADFRYLEAFFNVLYASCFA